MRLVRREWIKQQEVAASHLSAVPRTGFVLRGLTIKLELSELCRFQQAFSSPSEIGANAVEVCKVSTIAQAEAADCLQCPGPINWHRS
jgi:hypothetical protein